MDTLLFCYANDAKNPLPELRQEDEGIEHVLDARSSRGHFQKLRESFATTEAVAAKLQTYRDSLVVFHYSGHAGPDTLRLENSDALGQGLAQLLGQCPRLKLVFLNGCSTLGHVALVGAQGVKAAILATSTPINDDAATRFSLHFYRALANQAPLTEALRQARLSLQLSESIGIEEVTTRSVEDRMQGLAEVRRDQWYFFSPDPETARWELPTGPEAAQTSYEPNALLRLTTYKALGAYDPTLTELAQSKARNAKGEAFKNWLNDELLHRLPYPISEPLRRLLCPVLVGGQLIAPPPSRERLVNYLTLLDGHHDLVLSTLLAQLRDALLAQKQAPARLSLARNALLERLLREGKAVSVAQCVFDFGELGSFFSPPGPAHFVPGMAEWLRQLDPATPYHAALLFFEQLRQRLADPAGLANVPNLCQLGEEHLSEVLKTAGFWAAFRLESFKNIRVIRFYGNTSQYRHEKVVLRTGQSYPDDERYFQEVNLTRLWECQSVLLVRTKRTVVEASRVEEADGEAFLNLSPWLMDRNAYRKSDNAVFDLFQFEALHEGRLRFTHVGRPDDPPLLVGGPDEAFGAQEDYTLLLEQMQAFQTLLGQIPEETPPAPDDLALSLLQPNAPK